MSDKASHPWLQSLNVPAFCPKCGAPELRRSHVRSSLENFVKRYTLRRVFRCHGCGWRGWCDEAALVYPITEEKITATRTITADDEIPVFDLPDDLPTPVDARLRGHERSDAARAEEDRRSSGTIEGAAPAISDPAAIPVGDGGTDSGAPASSQQQPQEISPSSLASMETADELPQASGSVAGTDAAPRTLLHRESLSIEGQPPVEERPIPVYVPVSPEFHAGVRRSSSQCPACGKLNLHRSHSRGLVEKLRRFITIRRPYRCHSCGWRGWVRG